MISMSSPRSNSSRFLFADLYLVLLALRTGEEDLCQRSVLPVDEGEVSADEGLPSEQQVPGAPVSEQPHVREVGDAEVGKGLPCSPGEAKLVFDDLAPGCIELVLQGKASSRGPWARGVKQVQCSALVASGSEGCQPNPKKGFGAARWLVLEWGGGMWLFSHPTICGR